MSQITLLVALPLLAAFLLPLVSRIARPLGWLLGPAVLVAMIALVVEAWAGMTTPAVAIALGGFLPPLGISFHVDELALVFALAVPVSTLLLWPWDGGEEGVRRQSLTLLLAASCSGLALSGDLFNIYVFYELAAVATYGLVTDRRTAAGYAAAFRYLMISALGSVVALVGIALVYLQTGTLNLAHLATLSAELANPIGLAAFLSLLVGFGVKAELFPVNGWVPEVYGTASRRVSALLAGLVSKLAVLILVRALLLVFDLPDARLAMLALGVLGVLSGEFAAWRARDMARMLAWSSIGQLGLVLIAFSISGPAGIAAGLAVALHHLVVKPALFLLAERWGGALTGLKGAAWASPLAGVLFVLFALSLVGLPPLPGFWAKYLMLGGLAAAGGPSQLFAILVVLVATVVEANYLFRTAALLYARPAPGAESHAVGRHAPLALGTAALFGVVLLAGVVMVVPLGAELESIAVVAADPVQYVKPILALVQGG
jgi:formate hydrogenlyase subunit 3/multisubunit Na+/H+ antiporter MnhD subunit